MVVKLSMSLQEWILEEVIGPTPNRSKRIEELMIKGYLAEKEKDLKEKMPLLRFCLVTFLKLRLLYHRVFA